MTWFRRCLSLATLALSLLPRLVLADALPPDSCRPGDVGKACSNAGPNADRTGVCVEHTCTRPLADGGVDTYPCGLCRAGTSSGGATGSSSGAASSSGGAGSSGSGSSQDADGGGCSMSAGTRDGLTGAGMLGLGALAFAWSRRRPTPR